jgi:hypothetical protein
MSKQNKLYAGMRHVLDEEMDESNWRAFRPV